MLEDVDGELKFRLGQIDKKLAAIAANKKYSALFDSEDQTIIRVQANFAMAQKIAHDGSNVPPQNAVDKNAANAFHNNLTEYLMNIDKMAPNQMFGTTKIPDADALKALKKDIEEVRSYANQTLGLEDVPTLGSRMKDTSSAQDAIYYGKRSLEEAYELASNRTLTNVTGPGTEASKKLREAIDGAWKSLDAMVDKEGNHVIQLQVNGQPFADQFILFKEAMKEARFQADSFKRTYIPMQFAPEQRERAELIEKKLAEKNFLEGKVKVAPFEEKIIAVKALKATTVETKDPLKAKAEEPKKDKKLGDGKKADDKSKKVSSSAHEFSALLDPASFPNFTFSDQPDAGVAAPSLHKFAVAEKKPQPFSPVTKREGGLG